MRSLIIIELFHGEDTDALQDYIHHVTNVHPDRDYPLHINDYTVRVDIPECFELESPSTCDKAVHRGDGSYVQGVWTPKEK